MLSDIMYIPALRGSRFDYCALKDIDIARREIVCPLISARGKDHKDLYSFAKNWQGAFLLDISRYPGDIKTPIAAELNNPDNGYQKKREFFAEVKTENPHAIPVLGFLSDDPAPELHKAAKLMASEHEQFFFRVEGDNHSILEEYEKVDKILTSLPKRRLEDIGVIIDLQQILESPDTKPIKKIIRKLLAHEIGCIITCSTSWPPHKPQKNKSRYVSYFDHKWQAEIHSYTKSRSDIPIIYGDYAANNPTDAVEFVLGMAVLPFAGYYTNKTWYQERKGNDKETEKFRDIAANIIAIRGFERDFCTGTRSIAEIAGFETDKPGNNASWNRIRFNQHICSILRELENGLLDYSDVE